MEPPPLDWNGRYALPPGHSGNAEWPAIGGDGHAREPALDVSSGAHRGRGRCLPEEAVVTPGRDAEVFALRLEIERLKEENATLRNALRLLNARVGEPQP